MPAIGDSDDLYAWLIRGFVESGLPDHTRGGREWTAAGALNLENFIEGQGAGGILLEFRGQAGDTPVPEDDYTYQVCVVRGPEGTQVVVRSEDTLFHHAFPWGGGGAPRNAPPLRENTSDAESLAMAPHILGEVRAHNSQFTEWRAKGGVTTLGQRRGIPDVRGASADRALVTVLETLRRANRSVTEGPANRWWVKAKAGGGSLRIEAGLGQEPVYASRKSMVSLSAEDIAHAERLRTAGTLLLVSCAFSMLFLLLGSVYGGWSVYAGGYRTLASQGWMTIGSVCGSFVFALAHGVAGWRLRALRSKGLVTGLAVLGMLPCFAPCCVFGFPAGAWVLYLLRDERSTKVFSA